MGGERIVNLIQRRRALISQKTNGDNLSKLTAGSYSASGSNYTITDDGVISVTNLGALEANGCVMPFSPDISVSAGDSVSAEISMASGSAPWIEKRCNIFLAASDYVPDRSTQRLNLFDAALPELDKLTLNAVASTGISCGVLVMRLRGQGVSYAEPLRFTAKINVNGERKL